MLVPSAVIETMISERVGGDGTRETKEKKKKKKKKDM